jgi:Mrp family chromosome partitioning ATPase
LAEHLASADGSDAASFKHRVKHNLHVIPCGRSPVHSGIFDSHSFQKLRENLVASNDVVIYDSDATSQSLDALALLDQDAYLLIVVRMQHTKTESLKFLSGYLRQQKFSSGGLVFFGASERAMVKALNWRHA